MVQRRHCTGGHLVNAKVRLQGREGGRLIGCQRVSDRVSEAAREREREAGREHLIPMRSLLTL
jgi:hypothetical protein